MADRSAIEWCDSTFNPWIGCTKVSPACDNCYAEVSTPSRTRGVEWGAGKPRQRTATANWRQPLTWDKKRFMECTVCGWRGETPCELVGCGACGSVDVVDVRRRVFCASLADVFDNEVDPAWRHDLFELIRVTPNLDWLLLTKRPHNIVRMVNDHGAIAGNGMRYLPDNVWLGTTAEDQKRLDMNVPALFKSRSKLGARVLFVSIEPMLEFMNLRPHLAANDLHRIDGGPCIDWIIVGGESGPDARPMHPEWVRSVRDQCFDAAVPFLFKQWGEWAPRAGALFGSGEDYQSTDPQCKRWPSVIRLGEHGRNTRIVENCTPGMGEEVFMQKVGKKNAGRLLDGLTHDGYPEIR
jgi:protein gp37